MVPERKLKELQDYFNNSSRIRDLPIKSLPPKHQNRQKYQTPGKPGSGYRHQSR